MAYLRLPSAMLSSLGRSRLEVNIAVLGADNVGKSALTVRFLTGRFIGEYGDKESIYSHSIIIDGQEVCVNIWDSPSLHDQDLERLLGWADALLLVYNICERDTFAMLYSHRSLLRHAARRRLPPPGSRGSDGGGDGGCCWRSREQQRRRRAGSLPQPGVTPTPSPAPPLLLVGNKLDLEHLRTVASGEGRALALALDASFVEVSAADDCDAGVGGGVHRALGALARDALLPLLPLPATGIAGVDAGARGSSVSGGATGGAGVMNDGVAFVHPALHGRKGGFRGIVRSVSAVVFGRKRIHSL